MATASDIMTIDQAEALLVGLLKTGCARRKYAEPGVIDKLMDPALTMEQAGPRGSMVQNPWWGGARGGLIGAGAGGVLGFGRALFDKERRKRLLQETLQGALLGGGIGGGAAGLYHGINRNVEHKGPLPEQASNRFKEFVNRARTGGINGAIEYVDEGVDNITGSSVRDPSMRNTGAGIGAGLGGVAGFQSGLTAPDRAAAKTHARQVATHDSNATQRIHDLAASGKPNADVVTMLNRPAPRAPGAPPLAPGASPQTHYDLLRAQSAARNPNITATQIGMGADTGGFNALLARARAHGRPQPVPVAGPARLRSTVGRGIGGGILGALLGSQAPRLFGSSTPVATGYGQ